MCLSNIKLLRRPSKAGLKLAVIACLFASLPNFANAQSNIKPASVSAEDWRASGQDGIVALRLDGRVINIFHEQGRRYLRQGYGAARDDKRNVEASPPDMMMLPSRTKGFDWVLHSTGDGYYNIINLTTGLYLTLDGDDETNVSNWGQMASSTNHQKWRFVLSDTQMDFSTASNWVVNGTHGSFRIYNKKNNQPLTMYDFGLNSEEENVTVWPDSGPQAKGFDWALVPARDTTFEAKALIGNYKHGQNTQFISTSLASVRRLTIEKVRAIKVSTGQDDATKVLFTGIDLALDAGMGVATGGATAAAKTSLKFGARALTREALQAAAKAGLKKAAQKATKKELAKGFVKRTAKSYGKAAATDIKDGTALEFAKLTNDVLDAMSSEAIFNKFYGESPDDFYIKVNGSSIFPNGGRGHISMKSQDTRIVNKSFVFDRFDGASIQLREYDSASSDDSLGEVQWVPYYNQDKGVWVEFGQVAAMLNGKGYLNKAEREALPNIEAANKIIVDGVERYENVLISQDSEGSLYEVTYRVEPFVPAHMMLGKLHSKKLAERIKIWKSQEAQLFEAEQRRLAWVADRDAKAEAEARAAAAAEAARLAEIKRLQDENKANNAKLEAQWTADAQKLYGNCSMRGTVQSVEQSGGEASSIRMFNKGSRNINIFWIDTQGQEVDYGSQDAPINSIAPGPVDIVEIATPGFWYIATDDNGECVGLGNVSDFANGYTFNPDLVVAGAHPRKAVQGNNSGYDDGSGYDDQNEYADDQSGLPQEDPNQYTEDQNEYGDGSGYDDGSGYTDDYTGYDDGTNVTEGPGCEYLGQVGSQDGGDIVTVTFSNSGSEEMHIYWIDGEGNPANYSGTEGPEAVIPANSYQGVRTMIGHAFAAANLAGNCLAAMLVETDGENFTIAGLQ